MGDLLQRIPWRFVVKKERKGVKYARLEYRRLTEGETALVRIRLYTGRSHQIRVQLMNSGCRLTPVYDESEEISLKGDVNNLVQVIGNLLSNAIYAQKQTGGGEIELEINHDDKQLYIMVKDRGPGLSENVASQLFKNMITTKGSMGTGLGLFISTTVIRGKFKGSMWGENREGGGSVFGIAIPLEIVQIRKIAKTDNEGAEK